MADTFEVTRVKYAGEKENPHDTRSPFFKFYCTFKDSQGNKTEDCYWQRKSRQLNEGEFFYGSITEGEYGFRFKTEQRPKNASNGSGPSDTGSGLTRAEWAQKDRRIARAGIVQAVVTGMLVTGMPFNPREKLDEWLNDVDTLADRLLARLDQHTPHPSGSADGGGGTEQVRQAQPIASASPSAAVSASKGFASPSQEKYLKDCLKDAGADYEAQQVVIAYAEAELSGERDGPISKAIDGLKSDNRAEWLVRIVGAAEKWSAEQPNVPAPDTRDLAPAGGGFGVGGDDSDIPFAWM